MVAYPTSKQLLKHLKEIGPYTIDDLVKPFGGGEFGVCRKAGPSAVAQVLRAMPGRFTYEQAFDFCDYHSCDGYDDVDVMLDALLEKTDCTPEEREELLIAFGTEKLTDPIYQREGEELQHEQVSAARAAKKSKPGLFDILLGAAVADAAYDALTGDEEDGRSTVFKDVPFQDFNNAWGSNNDHNWEADGDTQWDSHGDGFPGGEE